MACCNQGKRKSSLESEREREKRNIARRELEKQYPQETKAILSQRAERMRQPRGR